MEIRRFFHLAYQEPVEGSDGKTSKLGFHYLIMDTIIPGEYGNVRCRCLAQTESPFGFKFYFMEICGESEKNLFAIRQDCINYFNSHILPLFNPLNLLKDGQTSFSEDESQDSQ